MTNFFSSYLGWFISYEKQVDTFYVGAALAAALGWRGNEEQGLTNAQPCRHIVMGEGQAQGLPLQGAIMPTVIWNTMPMCQPELNHPSYFLWNDGCLVLQSIRPKQDIATSKARCRLSNPDEVRVFLENIIHNQKGTA